MPPLSAIESHDRAFISIIDANVTTLLTAIILYFFSGPIKGFAITLSIVCSMFTTIYILKLFSIQYIIQKFLKIEYD